MADEQRSWLTEMPAERDRQPRRFQEVGLVDDGIRPEGLPDPLPALEPVPTSRRVPRWLVAATVAVVIVLTASLGGVWAIGNLLGGASADAVRTGYSYVPASATVAIELRLDLPAGQKEQLGSFLSRFPGFGDAGTVERRLVEALDDLVRSATQGKASYTENVQPFFSGWVIGAASVSAMKPADASPIVVFGVIDRDAAESGMLELRSSSLEWTSEEVDGVRVWSGGFGRDDLDFDFGSQSYAVTDDALLYGSSAEAIRDALAAHGDVNTSLLGNQRFADALRRVPAARLGLAWIDVEGTGATTMLRGTMAMAGPACLALIAAYPRDALAALYLRDGRAIVDVTYSRSAGGPGVPSRASVIDTHVPADTFFYAEAKRSDALSLGNVLDCLRGMPQFGLDFNDELDEELGEVEDLVSWIGDAGLAIRFDGSKLTGGLVVQATDELKAAETLGQLRAALTAMSGDGLTVTVSEETYRDARLVSFAFGGTDVRDWVPPMPEASLAYAMKDGLVVIGVDASFVRTVLDTEAADSLATKASYRRALEFAGATQNGGAVFIDVPAALALRDDLGRAWTGANMLGMDLDGYLNALDDVSVVMLGDDTTTTVRVTLNTRLPALSAP